MLFVFKSFNGLAPFYLSELVKVEGCIIAAGGSGRSENSAGDPRGMVVFGEYQRLSWEEARHWKEN